MIDDAVYPSFILVSSIISCLPNHTYYFFYLGMRIVATSEDETEVVRKLYEIAAGHTLILLAAAGLI